MKKILVFGCMAGMSISLLAGCSAGTKKETAAPTTAAQELSSMEQVKETNMEELPEETTVAIEDMMNLDEAMTEDVVSMGSDEFEIGTDELEEMNQALQDGTIGE